MLSMLKKFIGAAGLVLASALLLSGCVKFDVNLTVSANDTVNGTVTVGVTKELADVGDNMGDDSDGFGDLSTSEPSNGSDGFESTQATDEFSGLFAPGNGVSEQPYEDEKFIGTKYTFNDVPLEQFAVDPNNTSQLSIVRDGDNLLTSGTLDMGGSSADGFSDSDSFANDFLASLGETAEMKISITYPGQILETNGEVDGQTITWTPKLGETLEISAVVKAPETNWVLVISIIAAVALVVVVAATLLIFLRKNKRQKTLTHVDAVVVADVQPVTQPESNEVPTNPSLTSNGSEETPKA